MPSSDIIAVCLALACGVAFAAWSRRFR